MRLRQAHAILEAATALEAAGLGFELWPFDHDHKGAPPHITRDHMSGLAEFADPDMNGLNARIYSIEILPGPDDATIEVQLTYGVGPDPESLLYGKYSVASQDPDGERFRGLVGAQIAEKVAGIVREHEKPFRAAYEERARKTD